MWWWCVLGGLRSRRFTFHSHSPSCPHPSPTLTHPCPAQEAGLAPASQALLTDMLFIIRDAVDAALDTVSPPPTWAAPYGYGPTPAGSYAFPLWVWPEAEVDGAAGIAGTRRRLRAEQPPLPLGNPPPAHLPADAFEESYSDETYEGYRQVLQPAYAFLLYPAIAAGGIPHPMWAGACLWRCRAFSPISSPDPTPPTRHRPPQHCSDEADDPAYYAHLYDWLTGDEDELLALILSLPTQQPATGGSAKAQEPVPALPVYAVFAGSGRGGIVPSANGSAAAAQQARPLEVIVAPFATGAKPRTSSEQKRSSQFDPRWVGDWEEWGTRKGAAGRLAR